MDSEKKHPVWLLHYACAPVIGGVESIMSSQARVLDANGHSVTLVAGRGAPDLLVPEIDSRHPTVLAVQATLDGGLVPAEFESLRAEIRETLAGRLATLDGPVVIAHNAFTLHKNLALTAALADLAEAGAARFVAWCHDLAWTNPLYLASLHPGYPWSLLREPLPGVDYVAISGERQRELADLFGWAAARVRCVPNGIDAARFLGISAEMLELMRQLSWTERDPVLLAAVRMTRRKNLELGIAVTAALKVAGERPLLVVTGPPGPHNPRQDYAEFLLAERQRLGLEEEVAFLSRVPWLPNGVSDALMAELYRWADALFFPSLQEGFGLPLLEAGLSRLPVFCTDLPVLTEIGGSDVHYFSPDAEPAALAAEILATLAAAGPSALRRRVFLEYNWEAIYQNGLKLLL